MVDEARCDGGGGQFGGIGEDPRRVQRGWHCAVNWIGLNGPIDGWYFV